MMKQEDQTWIQCLYLLNDKTGSAVNLKLREEYPAGRLMQQGHGSSGERTNNYNRR